MTSINIQAEIESVEQEFSSAVMHVQPYWSDRVSAHINDAYINGIGQEVYHMTDYTRDQTIRAHAILQQLQAL